jgi:hypothetical protein
MAVYLEEYKGFLYDVPVIDFIRCDKKVFHYEKVSTSDANFNQDTTPINGGWGKLPLGFIETGMTQEVTFASAEFGLDMFEMANAAKMTKGDYATFEMDKFAVTKPDSALIITLPFECKAGTIVVPGFEVGNESATGVVTVSITAAAAATNGSTVLTFYTGDVNVGDELMVGYKRRVVNGNRVLVKNTSTTAKGELYLHYPISSSGDDLTKVWSLAA